MMTWLSETQRNNLTLLTDEWQTIRVLADQTPSGRKGTAGVAKAFSDLTKSGYAEWRSGGAFSEFRLTDAGRFVLNREATIVQPVVFLDERGTLLVIEGSPLKALFDELPEPTVGRKILPLYARTESPVYVVPSGSANLLDCTKPEQDAEGGTM